MGCFLMKNRDKKRSNRNNVQKINIQNKNNRHGYGKDDPAKPAKEVKVCPYTVSKDEEAKDVIQSVSSRGASPAKNLSGDGHPRTLEPQKFSYDELVEATERFKEEYFLGEGGFGRVYKGHLKDTGQVVAIKKLDRNGCQGIREFLVEVLTLSISDHPNLVNLIGYCAEGDQRLLVYEYMPLGSLEDHLHDPKRNTKRLDWSTRMKIAAGAAQGLEYLHDKMKPPVIYRDLKCSNILLGEEYNPKISDFGLAKLGPVGDKTHISTRVMGTYGYCAPDYAMTGKLTFKSDIYSFGVVLLELVTGRRAIDTTKCGAEKNLVIWAKPLFKDRKNFHQMADPALEGRYPTRGLYQSLAIAAMCLQVEPDPRPMIADVVSALNYLASQKFDPTSPTYSHRAKREQVTEHSEK